MLHFMEETTTATPQTKKPYDVIIQPNKITNARYEFTAIQKNIMIHIMGALQDKMSHKQETLFGEVSVNIALKDLDENRNYDRIREEAINMKKKDIQYEVKKENGRETEVLTSIISGISYEKGSRVIGIDIPSKAVPVLCYIGDGYTKMRQLVSLTLRSVYSKRLYELCCRWEDRGGFKIKVDSLREILAIPKTYKNSNIKQRVLDPSKKELKEDSDVYFEYELVKTKGSRSFDLINFKVITKKNHKLQTKEEKNLLNQEMYSSVYRFIQQFYQSEALKIADSLNLSGNLEEAYFRFGRLDDEYTTGKKNRSDVLRLIRHILKTDFDITI